MKKQIILLMTDTTRKDMVGCYGNKKIFTPNLDALAQEGIRYENAYTCQPVCGPDKKCNFYRHVSSFKWNGNERSSIGGKCKDYWTKTDGQWY